MAAALLAACQPADRAPAATPPVISAPMPPVAPAPPPDPAPAGPAQQQAVAAGPVDTSPQAFLRFLEGVRSEALAKGISRRTIDRALEGVTYDPSIIQKENAQPEHIRPFWDYLRLALPAERVVAARQQLATHAPILAQMERRFGVPPQIIVGFWGVESDFGKHMGTISVFRATASLAFAGRRKPMFRDWLMMALQIVDKGDMEPRQMVGSWAGAMGQTQFVPSIFLQYALDQDGDGKKDIWNSLPDVFASTANFVHGLGWRKGEVWGREVRLPAAFDWAQAGMDIRKPVAEWTQMGVTAIDGEPLPALQSPASLLAPAGVRGPVFLVGENFRVIMRYNPSTRYAMAVALLADRIMGGGQVIASWPVNEPQLQTAEILELQTLLAARGLDVGIPDGIFGPRTGAAVRIIQRSLDLPPDGYPTGALLARMRVSASM